MIVLTPEKAAIAAKYTKLRLDYAKSKDYDPYDREYQDAAKKADSLFYKEKKQREALAVIEPFIKKNPYCVYLLQTKASMLRAMGKTNEADEVRQTWFGIINSIMASGDGKSFQTAMQVISVAEEYDVLRVLKWEMVDQAMTNHGSHFYDILTVKNTARPDVEPFDIYFNIDIPFSLMQKEYSADPASTLENSKVKSTNQ